MTSPPRPHCARCGEPITPGARFCMKCGSDVSGEQGSVATAMLPVAQERDENDAVLELLKHATLGEYEILRELGRGGMATVYLAHDIALDRKVAIKAMSPALLLMGEGMVERFKREARTAANLSHPHIIPIYTVKSSGKTLFFVMKFIPGRSLEGLIKDLGPMPVAMVRAILQQVGGALGYAHRHGIVHRDVKPANIMIDEDGWSVVTDFGIAKVAENRGLTMTGIAVGTPSYMSPEQCAAKDITGKSDQYSLGVVAYEMLSGRQPFEGDSAMAIMFAHFHEQPRSLLESRSDCPPDLAAAVMRMLEKAPERRWPSMEDAITALGATPLAHDDPVRTQLVDLVRERSNRQILASVTPPPTSPVPPPRTRPAADAATTPIPTPRIVGVRVTPAEAWLHPGDTVQLAATAVAAGGTAATGRVEWQSDSPDILSVSPSGLVAALGLGSGTVTARVEGVSGVARIQVTPVPVATVVVEPAKARLTEGETLQLRAVLRAADQQELSSRSVAWSATPATSARVSERGLVTALVAGSVEISAECEGVRGAARLEVTPPPVAGVTLTPAERKLTVGDTAAFTAQLTDAAGKALGDRPLTWTSAAPKIAAVSPRGIVTGLAEGTVEILVRCEGKEARARVVVQPVPVASVTVAQPDPVIAGERVQLQPVLKDARGQTLTGRVVKWSSQSPGVAIVSGDGQLTGVAPGAAKVTVECEGKSWTVSVTVRPVPVAAVTIEGLPARLAVGDTAQLRAVVKDARGGLLSGREPTWSSSAPAVIAVTPAGAITARRPGDAMVSVSVEGRKAEARVVVPEPAPVAPPPAPPPPAAPARAPTAAPLAEATTVVITPPPRPAAPAPEPEAQPVAHEPVKRGAKGRLIAGVASVLVLAVAALVLFRPHGPKAPPGPAPVASLTIEGEPAPVAAGRTRQLAAVLRDSAGAELGGRAVSWSSSDPSVAEVSTIGAVTTKKPGTVTITATSEGQSDSFGLVVESAGTDARAPVASVTLAGSPGALEPGETVQLTAQVKDGKGNPLPERTVVWSTGDPQVALVSSSGLVTAEGPGQTIVTASSEGKSADLRITVSQSEQANPPPPPPPRPAPVAGVTLAPSSASVTVGQTVQLSATAVDSDRRALADRTVTWKSSDGKVARVADDGTVTAIGPGVATITAASEGKSASVKVSVAEATVPVAGVTLSSAARALKVGETATWSAAARDARGRELNDRTVSWSSSAPQVASVDGNGVITALAAGTADIRAEAEGKSASAQITVTAPVVVRPEPPKPAPVTPGPVAAPTAGGPTPSPSAASALLPKRGVEAGGAFSCGISTNGAVCWGGVLAGLVPVDGTAGIGGLTVGRAHACGIVAGGRAVCWGENRLGQLGDGSANSSTAAVPVAGDLSFSLLSAGDAHTCGVAGGRAFCWGRGKEGQLGDGSTTDRRRPVQVTGIQNVVAISAGGRHTCAITAAGKALCWGDGYSGQLGFGSLDQQAEPIEVSGNQKFTAIAAGGEHSCGVTEAGKAFCWGGNKSGQLGDGSTADRTNPVAVVGGPNFERIVAGAAHTCALTSGGEAWCWGDNKAGQLGDGSKVNRNKPVLVAGGPAFRTLSAGARHSCGLSRSGEALCWGDNDKGQLGDGSTTARAQPGPVRADR